MSTPERSQSRHAVPLARQVINVIGDRMAIEPSAIKETSTFTGDLRADSLEIAELGMDMEDAFGLPRQWEEEMPGGFSAITTVGDVIAFIERKRRAETTPTKEPVNPPATTANVQPLLGQSVKIPTSEDEAALMVLLGTNFLEEHAPHRLKKTVPDKTKEVALDLAEAFWWEEGKKHLKERGLNHHSGNEAQDRATLRAMLNHVYDLFTGRSK